MEDLLIWVNAQDEVIGYGGKLETHRREQLHRAFSVFVYDCQSQRVLLQRRAAGKYHSGGKWSNSCCSHPRKDEAMEAALKSRLMEELGLDVGDGGIGDAGSFGELRYMGKFTYYAPFDGLAEHEIDKVFVYYIPQEKVRTVAANPLEAEELKWVTMAELDRWLEESPQQFSAWFSQALELARPLMVRGELCRADV